MELKIVGIDCATQDAAVGVAFGRWTVAGARVDEVLCPGERKAATIIVDWLRRRKGSALIALDAPLGWPAAMGRCLPHHRAGQPIEVAPNDFFRRETDRVIRRELKKTPLDVGADRIARTAHAALILLRHLRQTLDARIPLAWSPDAISGLAAIEVYPAATLVAHSLRCSGYKKVDQVTERRELVADLRERIRLPANLTLCDASADALDAIVCVLAAADFLNGSGMPPEHRDLAEQEGWIWVTRARTAEVREQTAVGHRLRVGRRGLRG